MVTELCKNNPKQQTPKKANNCESCLKCHYLGKKMCLEWTVKNIFFSKRAMCKMAHLSHCIVKISKDLFLVLIFFIFKREISFQSWKPFHTQDWNLPWKMSLFLNILNENFAKVMASQDVLLFSFLHFSVRQINGEKPSPEGITEQLLYTQNLQ